MKPIKKYKIYWSPQFTNEFKKILTFMNCQFYNYSISNNFKNNIETIWKADKQMNSDLLS